MSPFTSSAPSAKASRASQSECALFHSSARSLKTGRSRETVALLELGDELVDAAGREAGHDGDLLDAHRGEVREDEVEDRSALAEREKGLRELAGQRPEAPAGARRQHDCLHVTSGRMGRRFYHGASSHERSEGREKAGRLVLRHRDEERGRTSSATRFESLVAQTVLPEELCIVDSSDEAPARKEIEELCASAGIRLDYVHPAARGLTVQRNVGIDRTSGDPVFLIDDDVWLDPDVHEEILAEYERWGPELGGVRGSPVHPPNPAKTTILWRRLFGMGGWWPEASGRMRGGFFVEGVSASKDVRRLEYMNGWFMSYRREVFDKVRFDENLSGYAWKEDIDFSYRVVEARATSSSRRRARGSTTARATSSASRRSTTSA